MEKQDTSLADRILVRPARPEDRGQVVAFCVNTFSWGDYIDEAWDHWLADESAQLLVAEVEGLPVGIQHVSFPSEREAYLQGMRVDPAVRRHGVANALFEAGMALARQRGARVARLLTRSDNEATHHMMETWGFRLAVTFTDRRGKASASAGRSPETAVPGDVDELWRLIDGSEHFHQSGRTYLSGWEVLELTKARLAAHVAAGEVFVLRQEGSPVAMAHLQRRPGDETLWAGGLYGETAPLSELARRLRAHAARVAASEVMAYVPKVEALTEALAAAGYRADEQHQIDDMDLFVKDLESP